MAKLGSFVKTPWHPWYSQGDVNKSICLILDDLVSSQNFVFLADFQRKVGGYVVEYQNMTFVNVSGAGYFVLSY